MIKKAFILILLLPITVFSQNDLKEGWDFSGYVEAYYSYDFNQPDDHLRPDFLFNFNRHNEFSINLALLRVAYTDERIRASLGLMGGTYAQYNLANEPAWAQVLNEASVGVKLHEKLWFDIGIMPSHIGFESWIGLDCWHLSRSIMADNSPYFLTGGRFTYEANEKLDLTLWFSNGWQNVQRTQSNQGLGMGLGLNYRPIEGLELNYSNYFGNEGQQPVRQLRFFNNFYAQYVKGFWGFTLGIDQGIQEFPFGQAQQWYGITGSVKRSLTDRLVLAGRAEYFSDPFAVILNDGNRVSGYSLNLDYAINSSASFRLEGRQFWATESVFTLPGGRFSKGNTAITTSFAVRF